MEDVNDWVSAPFVRSTCCEAPRAVGENTIQPHEESNHLANPSIPQAESALRGLALGKAKGTPRKLRLTASLILLVHI